MTAGNPVKFQSGTIVATVGASSVATREEITRLVHRHLSRDWGDVDAADAKANERAVAWRKRFVELSRER